MNEKRRFIFSYPDGRLTKSRKIYTFIELVDVFLKHPSALGGYPILEGIEKLKEAGFLVEVDDGTGKCKH